MQADLLPQRPTAAPALPFSDAPRTCVGRHPPASHSRHVHLSVSLRVRAQREPQALPEEPPQTPGGRSRPSRPLGGPHAPSPRASASLLRPGTAGDRGGWGDGQSRSAGASLCPPSPPARPGSPLSRPRCKDVHEGPEGARGRRRQRGSLLRVRAPNNRAGRARISQFIQTPPEPTEGLRQRPQARLAATQTRKTGERCKHAAGGDPGRERGPCDGTGDREGQRRQGQCAGRATTHQDAEQEGRRGRAPRWSPYLKALMEKGARLTGRCFPVVRFVCFISVTETRT